jgi:ABC-type multidrug transport system ATPase subunit
MLLTVEEIIHFYGKLRNVKDLQHLTKSVLDNFHLKPYKNVLVKNLSGGNRRKLSVACASFGELSLVLMDEPTSDMDPLTRHLVYKTIHELNDKNCSVILTSHSVAEIEQLCDSIGILVDGTMCASGPPESLKKQFGNRYVVTMLSEKALDYQFETVSHLTSSLIKIIFNFDYFFPIGSSKNLPIDDQPDVSSLFITVSHSSQRL